jgi:hypothetical protein
MNPQFGSSNRKEAQEDKIYWQSSYNHTVAQTTGRSSFHTEQTELFDVPTRPLSGDGSFPPSPPGPPRRPRRSPLIIVLVVVVLIVGLAGGGGWALMHSSSIQKIQVNTPLPTPTMPPAVGITPPAHVNPVSPLIFGTNLELYDTKDQALTSAKTRQLFQQMNVRIIRMPMRADGTMAPEFQGARLIKQLGAIPLVILHGDARVATALDDDTLMIQEMNRLFGNSLVYYEYGNEQDLNGVGVQRYTDSWNRLVPQLKKVANNANFIGPVNYQYNHDYLQYFLQNANPRPDEISWHEYTCDKSWAEETCLQHIDNWSKHISSARQVMKQTVGRELPIMITEWNYAPNPALNDGKISDAAFMNTWTTKAFQVLTANRIFASMIYAGTHPVFPLVAQDETLTVQGNVFKGEYQTVITQGKVPAALNGSDSSS